MSELRAAQQEHRRAKGAQQEAERSWQSERRALKDQYTVNVSHTPLCTFWRLAECCHLRPNFSHLNPHVCGV